MKLGINRKVETFDISDKTFEIRIVPVLANYLVVKHDGQEGDLEEQVKTVYEILEAILVANGYEFDKDWWEKVMDYQGFVEFITVCMAKDVDPKKKIKAVKA